MAIDSLGGVFGFTLLFSPAERSLWRTCRHHQACLRLQRQITLGKSHCR